MKKSQKFLRILLPLSCFLLAASCTWLYFQQVTLPAQPLKFSSLKDLPYRDLWSGFVFNGEKVGFTHLRISASEGEETHVLESEAHLRIPFLGVDKRFSMKSRDRVWPDLSLASFEYEIKMDEKSWNIRGEIVGDQFRATLKTGQLTKPIEKKLEASLYPVSAVNLYPLLRGLSPGAGFVFLVFDPQTQSFPEVVQRVMAFEKSEKLRIEPAYKIQTEMLGQSVSTWINLRGEAVFELGMGGVLITYKEDEETARRFLSEAAFSKKDLILDFSLVKTERSLPCPREATFLEVSLEGGGERFPILQGPGQEAFEQEKGGKVLSVYRLRADPRMPLKKVGDGEGPSALEPYLRPTVHLESDHPEIRTKAEEVVSGASSPLEKIQRLARWVAKEVRDETVDSLSALEVFHNRKGECQAHTMLYAAMARSVGIPTKLVGGLVYAEGMGFLYHAWAESYVDGWVAVDPTFDQVGVDATHIKLAEGPFWESLLPLGKVVGRIKAKILDYQASCSGKRD